jgi:hypothetical protein
MGSFFMENLHSLTVENKRKISATFVKEVIAFSDKEIKVRLCDGAILQAFGDNLKITAFDENSGNFIAVGNIVSVKYGASGKSIIKKVFK